MASSVVGVKPPARRELLWLGVFLGVSFVFYSVLLYLTESRYGDLSNVHTDHIHHARATWLFLNRGFEVYRVPFGELAPSVPYPHQLVTWGEFPVAYPVGMFVIFLPLALLGAWVPLSLAAWGKVGVLYVLALSHLGLFAVGLAMRTVSGSRVPVFIGIWMLVVHFAVHGFYDAIWMGLAAFAIWTAFRRRWVASLLWISAAALVSYRAVCLLPLGAYVAWQLLRSEVPRRTKLLTFLGVGMVGILVCWTFWMFTRHSPPPESPAYLAAKSSLLPFGRNAALVLGASVVVTLLTFRSTDWLVATTILWVTLLAILHAGHSWHGTVLAMPALLVGVVKPARAASFARGVLVVWMLAFWDLFFAFPTFVLARETLGALDRLARSSVSEPRAR